MKEDGMGEVCSTHGREGTCTKHIDVIDYVIQHVIKVNDMDLIE
jgi:hypothetical protein